MTKSTKQKKFERTAEGKYRCLLCDREPFDSGAAVGAHQFWKHGTKAAQARAVRRVKKTKTERVMKPTDGRKGRERISERLKRARVVFVRFCPFCGVRVPNAVVLEGTEKPVTVPVSLNFCSSCGERIPNAVTKQ